MKIYYLSIMLIILFFSSFTALAGEKSKSDSISCQDKYDSLLFEYNEYLYNDNNKAIEICKSLISLAKSCDQLDLIVDAHVNMGWAYLEISDYYNALDHAQKGYLTADKNNLVERKLSALNLKGGTYLYMDDPQSSFDHYEQAMLLAEAINDSSSMSTFYNNIAIAYENMDDLESASDYYHKALEIFKATDSKLDVALSYLNIGDLYTIFKKYDKAKDYQTKAYDIFIQEKDQDPTLFVLLVGMSEREYKQENYDLSKKHIDQAISLPNYTPTLNDWVGVFQILSDISHKKGDIDDAYENLKLVVEYKDSAINSDIISEIQKLQIEAVKENAKTQFDNLKKDNQIKDLELEKSKATQQNYFLFIILISLALAFALFMFYVIKKNSAKLKRRSEIIEIQSKEISLKNEQLEDFNAAMVDSINYAKRLQDAILPNNQLLSQYFNYSYLYLPKDVVSGDFYWFAQPQKVKDKDNSFLFAVADCTGHGVPGAMVSVVCANALNKSVYDEFITQPGKILDRTKELVEKTFTAKKQLRDGMDVSLISIRAKSNDDNPKKKSFIINYAGANNPLWIARPVNFGDQLEVTNVTKNESYITTPIYTSKTSNLFELKPDKQPVSSYEFNQPFETHEVEVSADDVLYLFSDGIQDQFGDVKNYPLGKKLKKNRLKKLLTEQSYQPVEDQIKVLDHFLSDWKEGLAQVDDICIFAIKLKDVKKLEVE
ncbi:MAG: tetratricopeptide repeat protein, partial [Brumimicrobium sp.]